MALEVSYAEDRQLSMDMILANIDMAIYLYIYPTSAYSLDIG